MGFHACEDAERPKLSDPAHGTRGLQPQRTGRVRCSALLAQVFIFEPSDRGWKPTKLHLPLETTSAEVGVLASSRYRRRCPTRADAPPRLKSLAPTWRCRGRRLGWWV